MERRASGSVEETRQLGRELAKRLPDDGVLLLFGNLGAGKTVLTQGIGEGLGLDPRTIQSPSYTLVREHEQGERRLIHVDLYRLEPSDLPALGLEELLEGRGLKVVEWAERLDFPVTGAWRLWIRRQSAAERRTIEIEINDGGTKE